MAAAAAHPTTQLAFLLPSGWEMVVVLIVGIMLFGRRLPEVGRTVGKAMVKMRQGFNKLRSEIDLESDVRELKETLRDTRDGLTHAVDAPRMLTDPSGVFQDLTDEALSSPGAPEQTIDPVPESIFEQELDKGNGNSTQ